MEEFIQIILKKGRSYMIADDSAAGYVYNLREERSL